ncbi:helix-turn-helix transcriptional regulator [Streptomyces jumonjinensis]|uniref:helix-turn-helix transcriptional regulator n=1 Tax=Streptomyces jumonjinensis TaxID=1945 RepID=UPI00379F607A
MTQTFGRRVAYWRDRRRITQTDLGALLGKSRRWVQAVEAGERQADPQISVIDAVARALRVPVERLLADPPTTLCVDDVELAAIRAALDHHDLITGTANGDAAPLSIKTLHGRIVHARAAFQSGRFGSLGGLVPALLVETNRAAALLDGDEQLRAYGLLATVLDLTEAAAVKYGASDVALVAGHRAVAAAERSGDPVTIAAACRHLADAMTGQGQPHAAATFAVASAARLETGLRARGGDGLSVLGMLYLKAAMAQSKAGAGADVRAASAARAVPALLDQADEHAAELGYDGNHMWSAFGPTNARIHRVTAHTHLSEGGAAVEVAESITIGAVAGLPRERRAHHLVDLARAHAQAGDRPAAVEVLLDAERESEEEVRCRPKTVRLVEDLRLLGAGTAEGRLRDLATRCGLPA